MFTITERTRQVVKLEQLQEIWEPNTEIPYRTLLQCEITLLLRYIGQFPVARERLEFLYGNELYHFGSVREGTLR